jgi:hypothetical protein
MDVRKSMAGPSFRALRAGLWYLSGRLLGPHHPYPSSPDPSHPPSPGEEGKDRKDIKDAKDRAAFSPLPVREGGRGRERGRG